MNKRHSEYSGDRLVSGNPPRGETVTGNESFLGLDTLIQEGKILLFSSGLKKLILIPLKEQLSGTNSVKNGLEGHWNH